MGELARTLSVWRGTAMMLNIVLGAGLLTLPGLAVRSAGDAALLVWAACALVALPLLIVFALLGRRHPSSGGIAGILARGMGDFGYVAGTLLFLGAVAFGLPAIALTGGHYAATIAGGSPYAWALGLVVAAALANAISAEVAGRINATLASLLLFVLIGVVVVGWQTVDPNSGHWSRGPIEIPSVSVLGTVFMMVFFAFTGWELGANLGAEFRNPRRDFPIAMGLSFVIVVALYAMLAVIVQAAGLTSGYAAPYAVIFERAFGAAGQTAISLIAVLLIFANLTAAIWAVSRMIYAAASERLLPAMLTRVTRSVPVPAVLATVMAIVGMLLAAWADLIHLGLLLAVAGQNFLLLYGAAAAVLIRTSDVVWQKRLGWLCVMLVSCLVALRGLDGLLYPCALLSAAALIAQAPARQKFRRHVEGTI
ncbi:MAG: APC family permease [Rhodobacteraceae bacterium]|nr:APC family permease [Paracoccaceae bacterium]